jgi:site-specific recombinase XerD
MTFNQALEQYMEYVKSMKSNGTYRFYSSHKTFPCKEIGNLDLEEIDQKVILNYINKQRTRNPKIKNVTINKQLKLIRQVYKHIMGKPLTFQLLGETKTTIKTISPENLEKMFSYFESNLQSKFNLRNYVYIRLIYETGLRLSEINNILVKNIDLEDKSILVELTKTDVNRYVFFSEDTALFLKKFIGAYQQNEFLFTEFDTGNVLSVSAVENMLRRLGKKLGIKDSVSPHKWRHTFATRFSRNNGNIEALRMLLGHSNLKTTQKYLHLNKDDLKKSYYSTIS